MARWWPQARARHRQNCRLLRPTGSTRWRSPVVVVAVGQTLLELGLSVSLQCSWRSVHDGRRDPERAGAPGPNDSTMGPWDRGGQRRRNAHRRRVPPARRKGSHRVHAEGTRVPAVVTANTVHFPCDRRKCAMTASETDTAAPLACTASETLGGVPKFGRRVRTSSVEVSKDPRARQSSAQRGWPRLA